MKFEMNILKTNLIQAVDARGLEMNEMNSEAKINAMKNEYKKENKYRTEISIRSEIKCWKMNTGHLEWKCSLGGNESKCIIEWTK